MKNCFFSIIVLMFLTGLVYPQKMKDKILKNKNKLEQLEKIKLIESLDMNEETSVRFFSRRNDLKKEIEILENRNEEIIIELENTFNSRDNSNESRQTEFLNELMLNRLNIEQKRQHFISSLNDIFSKEQVCKYVVFEKKFKDEIRRVLMDGKKHPQK